MFILVIREVFKNVAFGREMCFKIFFGGFTFYAVP